MLNKIPPQAIEIEMIVLGTLIIEPNTIFEVEGILKAESFYKDAHQKIYQSIIEVKNSSVGIDIMTITHRLKKHNQIDEVGGLYYLTSLMQNIGSSANLVFHALIIQQEYIKRLVIEKSLKCSELAYDSDLDDIIKSVDNLSLSLDMEIQNASGNMIAESQISLDEQINYEPHFLSIKQNEKLIGLFSKSNLSLILGKAKSRKTFAITNLAAHLCTGLHSDILWCKKMKVIYFDTEQSRFHAQKIIKRISFLNGLDYQPANFNLFGIKRYDTDQRKKIIETVIKRDRPEVVIIDGIRDLMLDFNDLRETTKIVNWLMMLMDKYNCHLSLILHLNKTDTSARGHLGTELINKCECALVIEKDEHDSSLSTVRPSETRGEQFKAIRMEIIEGYPYFNGFVDEIPEKRAKTYEEKLAF